MTSAPGLPAVLGDASRTPVVHARIGRISVIVLVAGLVLTGLLTWAAAEAHASNERRLLDQQAEEAASVLQQSVPAITGKAQEAARVAALLQDDVADLERQLAADVGEGSRFSVITVTVDGDPRPLAMVGGDSALDGQALQDAAEAALEQPDVLRITPLLDGDDRRLVYSAASATSPGLVAHAEQQLAPDPVDTEREGEAFEGIEFALYLGTEEDRAHLLLATTPELPIDGRRAERDIPFGDQTMRMVVSPSATLGGGLLGVFPWLTAAAGALSTAIATVLVESLHRRRRDAEAFTAELQQLYRREHAIAHTLQHSLLPTHIDRLEGIEVAARYFPGAEGAEIGGDWYDVIKQNGSFTVVVGDVVGRGVQAAAVMAAMRYGSHAVAGQVADPCEILQAVNALEHIRGDFVTMLCGSVDLTQGAVRFSSAGHPAPLVITAEGASYLPLESGPPIGFLDDARYRTSYANVPPGSVLVMFTDGLYERRNEDIDVGLERLRDVASRLTGSVEDILDGLAEAMLGDGVRDDTAMLGFRV